ncbi:hypothetical protein [Corynebacterium gerontici]|uniref:Uncharacterized protein n=1 Tax=Corynebacterium gerontici TaxID=2079234 RepID=A0A3G6IYL4_9CORY|nr:hypothetical protein [Corynebacterium gerontici]AZA10875.1 hypothetical protein CGERO_02755 [Corynebacterium gerontici]
MLVAIPGRNILQSWQPDAPEPIARLEITVPPHVRRDATRLLLTAMAVSAGFKPVASLKDRHFSDQVRRHINARILGGNKFSGRPQLESLHLRPKGQLIDAVGSVSTPDKSFGYLAQFEPSHNSTLSLRMRSLRVL